MTRSHIKHVRPHPNFLHDATWWRSKCGEADKLSLPHPAKGNTIESSEQKNSDSLPLYMHAGRYQVLFCIIGRGRVNVYPLYNKL
jgi:hypothetical protein